MAKESALPSITPRPSLKDLLKSLAAKSGLSSEMLLRRAGGQGCQRPRSIHYGSRIKTGATQLSGDRDFLVVTPSM